MQIAMAGIWSVATWLAPVAALIPLACWWSWQDRRRRR